MHEKETVALRHALHKATGFREHRKTPTRRPSPSVDSTPRSSSTLHAMRVESGRAKSSSPKRRSPSSPRDGSPEASFSRGGDAKASATPMGGGPAKSLSRTGNGLKGSAKGLAISAPCSSVSPHDAKSSARTLSSAASFGASPTPRSKAWSNPASSPRRVTPR